MPGPATRTFVFETTNAALWAEEVAGAAGVPVEVVPAPAASRAKCDIALRTRAADVERLEAALAREGVPHRVWA